MSLPSLLTPPLPQWMLIGGMCMSDAVCVRQQREVAGPVPWAGHTKKEICYQEDLRTKKTWTSWFYTAEFICATSYQDWRLFSAIYWMIYWDGEKKKRTSFLIYSFLSLIIMEWVNTSSSRSWNFREKKEDLDPKLGSLSFGTLAIPSPCWCLGYQCAYKNQLQIAWKRGHC